MPLPLSGLLVVSLEQAVAAPMCTCRLADAGARVIKVERPEGDFARGYDKLATLSRGGRKTPWCLCAARGTPQRSKRVCQSGSNGQRNRWCFRSCPRGRLAPSRSSRARVFVQNLKPGAIAKLGFRLDLRARIRAS
jgi:formyl-CoA transferase